MLAAKRLFLSRPLPNGACRRARRCSTARRREDLPGSGRGPERLANNSETVAGRSVPQARGAQRIAEVWSEEAQNAGDGHHEKARATG